MAAHTLDLRARGRRGTARRPPHRDRHPCQRRRAVVSCVPRKFSFLAPQVWLDSNHRTPFTSSAACSALTRHPLMMRAIRNKPSMKSPTCAHAHITIFIVLLPRRYAHLIGPGQVPREEGQPTHRRAGGASVPVRLPDGAACPHAPQGYQFVTLDNGSRSVAR